MIKIDEKILNFCGIYGKPEINHKKIEKTLKQKQELEKLTGMKIEKIYVIGSKYWGKNPDIENAEVCFIVDERSQDLGKINGLLEDYIINNREHAILFWGLCQFEKRSQSTGELAYYIANYGKMIYDSGKETTIDERVTITTYAIVNKYFKENRKYISTKNSDILFRRFLEKYILKIGYYVEENELSMDELFSYANYIGDNKIKQYIKQYSEATNKEDKIEVCKQLEKYIEKVKQYAIQFRLPKEPTMRVYERKKEKFDEGEALDIKDLNQEDEYIMYVIEKKNSYEIARLYGVQTEVITRKNNNWNIRVREEIVNYETMVEIGQRIKHETKEEIYSIFQQAGMLSFDKCINSILQFMKAGEKYLLREFWKFTEFEKEALEEEIIGKNSKTWYRATLAMDFLKENGLVEEIDFKKYRVTKLGREIVNIANSMLYRDIDIKLIAEELKEIKIFGISFKKEDIDNAQWIDNIKNKIADLEEKELDSKLIKKSDDLEAKRIKINSLEVNDTVTGDCKIKKYKEKKKIRTSNRPIQAKKTSEAKIEIPEELKINLGINGEKYLYKCLKNNKQDLLKCLEIDGYKSIIFYNADYDTIKEDKSIGHGCDIELILKNNKHIFLEVKTSLDNTEFYTMTYNEYKCNLEEQDNYFIIKINNFKYLNIKEDKINMTVIKNPYSILQKNANLLKNITLYTNY